MNNLDSRGGFICFCLVLSILLLFIVGVVFPQLHWATGIGIVFKIGIVSQIVHTNESNRIANRRFFMFLIKIIKN